MRGAWEEEAKRRERIRGLIAKAERLEEAGRYREARNCWREVIEAGGDEERAREGIARAEAGLEKQERKRKERQIRELVTKAGGLEEAGEYEQAIEGWRRVIAAGGDEERAREGIARAEAGLEEQQRQIQVLTMEAIPYLKREHRDEEASPQGCLKVVVDFVLVVGLYSLLLACLFAIATMGEENSEAWWLLAPLIGLLWLVASLSGRRRKRARQRHVGRFTRGGGNDRG